MGSQVPGKRNTILSMFQTLRQHLLQCDDLHFELQVAKLNRVFQTEINASKSESEIITTLKPGFYTLIFYIFINNSRSKQQQKNSPARFFGHY